MYAFRHPVFQRIVALLLFAGVGGACVPVASAATSVDAAFESELRAALGESEALELALDAARRAPTHEAATEAFIQAYVTATGDAEAAQDIARLLRDHPNRFGAPAVPPSEAVWTTASSTTTLVHRIAPAVLGDRAPAEHPRGIEAILAYAEPTPPGLRCLRTQQARAP